MGEKEIKLKYFRTFHLAYSDRLHGIRRPVGDESKIIKTLPIGEPIQIRKKTPPPTPALKNCFVKEKVATEGNLI